MYENIYSLQSEAIVLLLTLFCPYTHAPSIVHCTSPPYLGYLCKALGPPMGGYPADLAKDRIVTVGSLVLCPSLASPSLVHCAPYPIVLPVQRPGRLRQGTLWIILVGSVIHLLGTVLRVGYPVGPQSVLSPCRVCLLPTPKSIPDQMTSQPHPAPASACRLTFLLFFSIHFL